MFSRATVCRFVRVGAPFQRHPASLLLLLLLPPLVQLHRPSFAPTVSLFGLRAGWVRHASTHTDTHTCQHRGSSWSGAGRVWARLKVWRPNLHYLRHCESFTSV
ncbi:hypothetical protein E2C01_015242 [Portunus trituberculatus]|uniref:Secreted protein n=1 Tax=Portunus trituberculatus TaxID=210409 RepID=A0A5B7DKU4_PORTR|nr:hypothetical protein [Portunus trituberculatus]